MAGAFCPICYEVVEISSQNLESVAGCGHVFHQSCLQQWVAHSPVSPKCPLCKASCGPRERQRLYFQTSADCSQQLDSGGLCLSGAVHSEADLKHVRILDEKVRLLKKSLELARQQISELQAAVEENKTKVQTISEIARLANQKQNLTEDKLRRAEQELDGSRKEKIRLMKEMGKLARDIAATKLVENVDLSEDEVLNLTSGGGSRPQSKDEYIQILAKALVTRNWAFKNLMTTCNEHCLQKDHAKKESSKLRAKVEQLQAKLKELVNAQERSENATLRSLYDVQTRGDVQSGRLEAQARTSMNRPANARDIEFSARSPTLRIIDHDELNRAHPSGNNNLPDTRGGREEMDADSPSNRTTSLLPRATVPCTRTKDGAQVFSFETKSAREHPKSSITEIRIDETIPLDLDVLPIPIRRERKSSLVEDSFSSNSAISWKETAQNLAGSTNFSRFNLSGLNGPSSVALVKRPPSFIVPAPRVNNSSRQGKRPKVTTPQDSKIEHFFGRH